MFSILGKNFQHYTGMNGNNLSLLYFLIAKHNKTKARKEYI